MGSQGDEGVGEVGARGKCGEYKKASHLSHTLNVPYPILFYERLRQRLLVEKLRVACLPAGVRSVQVPNGLFSNC
ncbi:hypothetical protein H1Q63_22530 [Desmonostoc muscorum CCALA 125]|nr:hypothetical protein [Desmonostoc muscorum CCALA 125]